MELLKINTSLKHTLVHICSSKYSEKVFLGYKQYLEDMGYLFIYYEKCTNFILKLFIMGYLT